MEYGIQPEAKLLQTAAESSGLYSLSGQIVYIPLSPIFLVHGDIVVKIRCNSGSDHLLSFM
jgi:hypothetical protein